MSSGTLPSWQALIAVGSAEPEIWYSILSCIFKDLKVTSVTELTENQFNIFSWRLGITLSSINTKAVFMTWLLSDCKDLIKFPMKPKFNAVRQDHMLTPRVSFSQLAACKLFEKYSKDELFDQLFNTKNKKRIPSTFFASSSFKNFVTIWKPELKPTRSDRTTGYYLTDGETVYFVFNRDRPEATTTDWRVWICPDNDTWLKIKKQYNLEDPKLCSVVTEVKTYTYENTEYSYIEVIFKEYVD
jgi:hypothetical protein